MAKVWVVTSQVGNRDNEQTDEMSVERVYDDHTGALKAVEKLKRDFAPDGMWDEEEEQTRAGSRKMAEVWVLNNGPDCDEGYGVPMQIKITECVVEHGCAEEKHWADEHVEKMKDAIRKAPLPKSERTKFMEEAAKKKGAGGSR
jgi:hypothetical protein